MSKQTPKEKSEARQDEEHLRKNPVNDFLCLTCKDSEVKNLAEFKEHLINAHNVNPDDKEAMKGTRQMTMHMDGSYWFSSNYNWTLSISGVRFSQWTKNARAKDDWMRHHD